MNVISAGDISRNINGEQWEGVALTDSAYHEAAKHIAKTLRMVGIPARVVKLPATGGIGGRIECSVLLIPSDRWIDLTPAMHAAFDKLEHR